MAYGSKIYGSTGALQVDDTYETYVYAGNYSLTYSGNGGDPYNYSGPLYPVYHNSYVDIVSTSRPIIFYKPPYSYKPNLQLYPTSNAPHLADNQIPGIAMVALVNIGGNTWRGYFVEPWVGGSGVTPLKVFVSTKSKGPSTDTNGLRVYNSGGTLVFDAGWKLLNPIPQSEYFQAIQINVSNQVGTQIGIYSAGNGAFSQVVPTKVANDTWISLYTTPPTILNNLQPNTAYYYTYIFLVFSMIDGGNYQGIFSWPAIVNNSSFPPYNMFLGSNVNTNVNYLTFDGMSTFYP